MRKEKTTMPNGMEVEIHIPDPDADPAFKGDLPTFTWLGVTTVLPDGTVKLPDGTISHIRPGRDLEAVRREWLESPAGQRFLTKLHEPPQSPAMTNEQAVIDAARTLSAHLARATYTGMLSWAEETHRLQGILQEALGRLDADPTAPPPSQPESQVDVLQKTGFTQGVVSSMTGTLDKGSLFGPLRVGLVTGLLTPPLEVVVSQTSDLRLARGVMVGDTVELQLLEMAPWAAAYHRSGKTAVVRGMLTIQKKAAGDHYLEGGQEIPVPGEPSV